MIISSFYNISADIAQRGAGVLIINPVLFYEYATLPAALISSE